MTMPLRAAALVFLLAGTVRAAPASSPRVEDAIRESVLRLAAGDVLGAETQAKAAVAAGPNDPRALQQLALAANAALDFAAAEDAATRGLAAGGPPVAFLCLRSEARAGKGDGAGALADAQSAIAADPGSGQAFLRRAVAEEGLGRPAADALADYKRAAQLDVRFGADYDGARERLRPRPRGRGWTLPLVLAAAAAAVAAWALRRRALRADPAARAAGPSLPGAGRLDAATAARLLADAAASAPGPDETRTLAESLYERLTGRAPYPVETVLVDRNLGRFAAPSSLAAGLPVGVDGFFLRALNPDPERRFRSGAELAGAFRSLVDPAVD
ncbi:MAG: hypothetical protein HKL90_14475 [Elusimicrobia bacterium]|nr:hypothetical protein [Elusimicrobiota bacterium]